MTVNKTSLYVAMVCAVFAAGIISVAVWSSPSPEIAESASAAGQLAFSETDWDFGAVSMKNGIATKEIRVTNPTENPITVTRMETSCMCTTVQLVHENGRESPVNGMPGHGGGAAVSEILAPGEEARLLVRFDPNAHGPSATGPISRTVTIQTDSADQKNMTLRFSGNVTK